MFTFMPKWDVDPVEIGSNLMTSESCCGGTGLISVALRIAGRIAGMVAGFTLIHLLLTALVAFLLGRYI